MTQNCLYINKCQCIFLRILKGGQATLSYNSQWCVVNLQSVINLRAPWYNASKEEEDKRGHAGRNHIPICSFSTSRDINGWLELLVDYCDVLSAVWTLILTATPSLQEHPLVSKWCNAYISFSKSDEETNSSTSWLAWEWVSFQQIVIFGWTTPLIEHSS